MGQLFAAFGLNLPVFIAQAVNFAVMLIGLWYLLYKPIGRTLEARRQKIAQGVADAEAASAKLATADAEAEQRVRSAETEAEEILVSARTAGQQERTRIVQDAETRAASVAADADARAKETAARTLRESEKEIARLAVLAAEKVLHQKETGARS